MIYAKSNVKAWTQLARFVRISNGLKNGTIKTVNVTSMSKEELLSFLRGDDE